MIFRIGLVRISVAQPPRYVDSSLCCRERLYFMPPENRNLLQRKVSEYLFSSMIWNHTTWKFLDQYLVKLRLRTFLSRSGLELNTVVLHSMCSKQGGVCVLGGVGRRGGRNCVWGKIQKLISSSRRDQFQHDDFSLSILQLCV